MRMRRKEEKEEEEVEVEGVRKKEEGTICVVRKIEGVIFFFAVLSTWSSCRFLLRQCSERA